MGHYASEMGYGEPPNYNFKCFLKKGKGVMAYIDKDDEVHYCCCPTKDIEKKIKKYLKKEKEERITVSVDRKENK